MYNHLKILFLLLLCSLSAAVHADADTELTEALSKHKDKVIYLDFWASWCGPCRKSFPWMNQMQEKYQTQGFAVISVNLDHNRALASEFLQQVTADFPVIYDPKGQLMKLYNVQGMPTSYILGRQGEIISSHMGFSETKIAPYEEDIRNALAR